MFICCPEIVVIVLTVASRVCLPNWSWLMNTSLQLHAQLWEALLMKGEGINTHILTMCSDRHSAHTALVAYNLLPSSQLSWALTLSLSQKKTKCIQCTCAWPKSKLTMYCNEKKFVWFLLHEYTHTHSFTPQKTEITLNGIDPEVVAQIIGT